MVDSIGTFFSKPLAIIEIQGAPSRGRILLGIIAKRRLLYRHILEYFMPRRRGI
jgi:hypothetical protein